MPRSSPAPRAAARSATDTPAHARRTTLGRLGSFVVVRRRWVLSAWFLLVVVGFAVGGQVFGQLKESNGSESAESVAGFNLMQEASDHGMEMVAVVDGAQVASPTTEQAVQRAADKVRSLSGVTAVVTAYDAPDPQLRSADGRASLVLISTRKTDDMTAMHQLVEDARDALADSVPGATVKVGGGLAVMRDEMVTSQTDLVRGEMVALPILLIALLFVFRGFLPALLPLATALTTVAGALLLLLGATNFVDVAGYAVDVVALFGLALAVDYSLLMVTRYREERGAGHDKDTSVIRSVERAGRTLSFSALTVMASLAGLFAFTDPTFSSLAIGGIATTVIALAGGLTLVPALLAAWGNRIKGEQRADAADGSFGRLARAVQRRPVLVATLTSAALIAAAVPFLSVNYASGDPRILPASFESRQVVDTLLERFPGKQADPVQVVATVPGNDPRVADYAKRVRSLPGVTAVDVDGSLSGDLAVVNVVPSGTSQGQAARDLVQALRENRPEFTTYVTGTAAFLVDYQNHISERLPWALTLIALATFVLLFLMTGSVLVPLKALIMNVLSLGATFGALVWIFQDGHFSGLLDFQAFGAIEVWVPVVVFVFAFGLSMDYEVFLLSRIKECYDECGNSDKAVANGLQRSGRIITSAAILVIIVFLGFATGQNLGIKQMGLALAIAVLVDATIVRCLLVPATMTLLGNANWWAPRPLRRLHQRFGLREEPREPDLPPPAENHRPADGGSERDGAMAAASTRPDRAHGSAPPGSQGDVGARR